MNTGLSYRHVLINDQAMTPAEVSGGLVLPYASQAVAGKGGAVAILLILFMVY